MGGIWIRTQDRKGLIYANRIMVEQFKDWQNEEYKFRIVNQVLYQDSVNDYDLLGVYNTEERAIEVLDDIQKRHFSSLLFGAYEMPEE